uniref:Uncharacterized protein n=1 Tax=viral metagenome TaxID=1070528 RepID=A0A6C0LQX4_9ZZZZ
MPNRKSTRSSRKNRNTRSIGFTERLYGPVNQGLGAVGNVGLELTNTVGNVFGRTVKGVRRVGSVVTGRFNNSVSNLVSGKSRKNRTYRKNRSTRKNRTNRNRNRNNRN